jgi:mannose-6-phosphate isomerase-like protein (cupin superfamily)
LIDERTVSAQRRTNVTDVTDVTDVTRTVKTDTSKMTAFSHNADQSQKRKGKAYVKLVMSDVVTAEMQIVTEGGENNMHSHPATDGFWWVVRGSAKFYDESDELTAIGEEEGIFVPRGVPYWFEKGGDEPLHLLHVAARSKDLADQPRRVNHQPRNDPPPDPTP